MNYMQPSFYKLEGKWSILSTKHKLKCPLSCFLFFLFLYINFDT